MIYRIAVGVFAALIASSGAAAMELSVTPAEQPEGIQRAPASHHVVVPYSGFAHAIAIDGKLDEWDGEPTISLGDNDLDLSLTAWLLAKEDAFYLAVDVTDDIFEQTFWGDDLWQGDSIQIAIDPLHDRTPGHYGHDDHEIGLALTEKRPLVWRFLAPKRQHRGIIKDAELAVVRDGNHTVYELRLPFSAVEYLCPPVFPYSGFTLVVNDSDTPRQRDSVLAWTSGIADTKNPAAFRSLLWPTRQILADHLGFDAWIEQGDPFAPVGSPHQFTLAIRSDKSRRLYVGATVKEERVKAGFSVPQGLSWYDLTFKTDGNTSARLRTKLDFMDEPLGEFVVYRYEQGK
jgi:hypothetical protein